MELLLQSVADYPGLESRKWTLSDPVSIF